MLTKIIGVVFVFTKVLFNIIAFVLLLFVENVVKMVVILMVWWKIIENIDCYLNFYIYKYKTFGK